MTSCALRPAICVTTTGRLSTCSDGTKKRRAAQWGHAATRDDEGGVRHDSLLSRRRHDSLLSRRRLDSLMSRRYGQE